MKNARISFVIAPTLWALTACSGPAYTVVDHSLPPSSLPTHTGYWQNERDGFRQSLQGNRGRTYPPRSMGYFYNDRGHYCVVFEEFGKRRDTVTCERADGSTYDFRVKGDVRYYPFTSPNAPYGQGGYRNAPEPRWQTRKDVKSMRPYVGGPGMSCIEYKYTDGTKEIVCEDQQGNETIFDRNKSRKDNWRYEGGRGRYDRYPH